MAEAQNSEHDAAQMSSSQATFVPSRETQPPTSAQGPGTIRGDRHDDRGKDGAVNTKEANVNISGVNSTSNGMSFTDAVRQYQEKLDQDFLQFEEDLQARNPQYIANDIDDWDVLENEYQMEVGNVVAQERDIMDVFDARFKVG